MTHNNQLISIENLLQHNLLCLLVNIVKFFFYNTNHFILSVTLFLFTKHFGNFVISHKNNLKNRIVESLIRKLCLFILFCNYYLQFSEITMQVKKFETHCRALSKCVCIRSFIWENPFLQFSKLGGLITLTMHITSMRVCGGKLQHTVYFQFNNRSEICNAIN